MVKTPEIFMGFFNSEVQIMYCYYWMCSTIPKISFKGFNQIINNIIFNYFLNLEQGNTPKNTSKLKWKRESGGIKKPHPKVGCENCDESKKGVDCVINPERNCFNCERRKSCQDCLSKTTRIADNSLAVKKVKRKPENEFGYLIPYYKTDDIVMEEEPVQNQIKKYSKCEIEINPDNYLKNKTICII